MAKLPQNNTARLFVDYLSRTSGIEHTIAVRMAPAASDITAQGEFLGLLNAIGASRFWSGWHVTGCRVQQAGADFSLPVGVVPSLASFVGTGATGERWQESLECSFVGRSPTSGRKARLPFYGLTGITLTTNYRISGADDGMDWVADAVDYLNEMVAVFVAIDGSNTSWYNYLNWQFNSHWESAIRKLN